MYLDRNHLSARQQSEPQLSRAAWVMHVIDHDAESRQMIAMASLKLGFAVATHASGSSFLNALRTLDQQNVACILMEISLPDFDGLSLLRQLRERHMQQPVIMMTADTEISTVVRAMKAGATDLLQKPVSNEMLHAAITSPIHRGPADSDDTGLKLRNMIAISKREREVLDLLVAGMPYKAIGRALAISPRTVETHRTRILSRLQVQTPADAARLARQPLPDRSRPFAGSSSSSSVT